MRPRRPDLARSDTPVRLSITTWNINSVRLRLPLIRQFLDTTPTDILCLQETKCRDDIFPLAAARALGFEHVEINGQKGYHGVAVFSRVPIATVEKGTFCRHGHARHMAVTLGPEAGPAAGLTIHNFYVPAGGDVPDPVVNPKFDHKLHFLDTMREGPERLRAMRAVLVGDLNIAPLDTDVWSHRQLLGVVSHTPIEVERLGRVQAAGPWIDALRAKIDPAEKLFTWWSYRAADWAATNKGRRLDHVWLSPDIAGTLQSVAVCREARGWDRPSDHVPVTVTLAF